MRRTRRTRRVASTVGMAVVLSVLSFPTTASAMRLYDPDDPVCSSTRHHDCIPAPSPSASASSPTVSPSPSRSTAVSPSPNPSSTRTSVPPSDPFRAFSGTSYWNTPLPANAPIDPSSSAIISFIKSDSVTNFIRLGGTSSTGAWGNPIYWAGTFDPTYTIRNSCSLRQPTEFSAVRIPLGARPDPTSDASMTVYDGAKGIVYGLWRARYDAATNTWSSCGGTVYYLASNGLDGSLAESNQPDNRGHRGAPPSTWAVRYDEILAGSIDHVLKISVDTTKCAHTFPMVGDECGTSATFAPPEGTRIRIKPSIDLTKLGLSPAALTVARALQTYGAVIGDQSGGAVSLKVENTIAEGLGRKWSGVLSATSLSRIPLEDFEVIRLGYGR